MRRKVAVMVVGLLAAQAGVALAQYGYDAGKLEIIPFGGYRWGGGLSSVSGIRDLDTQDTYSFGVALDFRTPKNSAVELYWSHFEGDLDVTLLSGVPITGGPVRRDDIMINGLWYAYREAGLKPYLTAGLGASVFSADRTDTIGRFAWNIGIGVRGDMSERLGIRVDGRWVPTWVTTGSGVWCDPFYCYSVGTGEYYDQFELTGGLILKL